MVAIRSGISNCIENSLYETAGMLFLLLAKVKYRLRGYASPRPFAVEEYEKSVEYDFQVVNGWLSSLRSYAGQNASLENKEILELGPGADLGVGLYLLSKGVRRYNAIDINNLVEAVPPRFYELFFQRLKQIDPSSDIEFLSSQLKLIQGRKNDKLNYVCRDDFDIGRAFAERSIDIVFSQAAFEHFDDVERTVAQLNTVTKPGSLMITEIDLRAHSRWIRDKDPNNIYRYSEGFYRLFGFPGVPNRLRPCEYRHILEKHGWKDIRIVPLKTLPDREHEKTRRSLNRRFRDERNQMNYLSVMLCATRN